MSKTLRLSEKWFHRGLWLVALIFASFLIEQLSEVQRREAINYDLTLARLAKNVSPGGEHAVNLA